MYVQHCICAHHRVNTTYSLTSCGIAHREVCSLQATLCLQQCVNLFSDGLREGGREGGGREGGREEGEREREICVIYIHCYGGGGDSGGGL